MRMPRPSSTTSSSGTASPARAASAGNSCRRALRRCRRVPGDGPYVSSSAGDPPLFCDISVTETFRVNNYDQSP
jgi:hypothetical protein